MKPRFFVLTILLGILLTSAFQLTAQEYLDLDSRNHCLYFGEAMPEELYKFAVSDSILQLKEDILEATGEKENFTLLCANVPSVAAVVTSSGKRYLLYSRKFFVEHPDPEIRALVLAHEIGHHVNLHRLKAGRPTEAEEQEADAFAGYALGLMGLQEAQIGPLVAELPLSAQTDSTARQFDLMQGFRRAEASLKHAEHAAWTEEEINRAIANFPHLELPMPHASAEADLNNYFSSCRTLSDADRILRNGLDAGGYDTRKYFYVQNGFAIVTREEQFNADGTSKSADYRWSKKIVRCESFSVGCYMGSLLGSTPGYFRVYVFVVTSSALAQTDQGVNRDRIGFWLNKGVNRLPPEIGSLPFDAAHTNVSTLVYEFKVRESDQQVVQSTPSALPGLKHLRKSNILYHLRR